ncbi:MAG: Zinc-specific metallo-regulatory protein [Pelotomaculum sp. PtaU1.Bin065]|jgi:Fur family ferric uptake transcriptional regulator|nr:MAG: Zinc-specific metallo-regulatory protein [Pelotomaculum sp. PtaU1.Bin065]
MDIVDDLKRSGLKNTKCRAAILDILEQSDQPVAADRLFHELNEKNIMLSFSTVYRTLEALTDKKLVKKLTIAGEDKALFEYNRKGHRHYLICLGCKKILSIEHCPLKGYEEILKKETDYAISGHKLDIYGYCPDCQKHE